MKRFLATLMFLPALVWAQEAPKPPTPKAAPPTLTETAKLAIRDAQVKMLALQIQATELQRQMQQAQQELVGAVNKAYTDAKVNQDAYDIDIEKMIFVAKPPTLPKK